MELRIRPAKRSEAKELTSIALDSKAFWGYSPEFIESCRAELTVSENMISDAAYAYWAAELGGRLTGFYGLRLKDNEKAELEALFVVPSMIGKGTGKKLIEHAKAAAGKLGLSQIEIQGDPNAEKFYLAVGAEPVGQKESGSIPGRMLPLYRIRLGDLV